MELNKRFTVKTAQGLISEEGQRAIGNFIASQRLDTDELWQARNENLNIRYLPALPRDWEYQWMVTGRGEYVGSFSKRVAKFYYQKGIKCPSEFIQEIGNIARRHTEDETSYDIEFVDTFQWRAGEFGDRGSCYWGGRSNARDVLENEGAIAIRFYQNDKGFGRAWIVPIKDAYILFNGYGHSTLVCARVLATFLGMSYKKITVENHGSDSGTIYINAGKGYVIGLPETIASINHWDLDFDTDDITCEDCGDHVHEDETYVCPDGYTYCQDCFYDICFYCDDCGEAHWNDNRTTLASGREVCEYCCDRSYMYCEKCDEYYPNDDIYCHDDACYCTDCFEKEFSTCKKCEETKNRDTINEGGLCDTCTNQQK